MLKNKETNNTLIKRKGLLKLLRGAGIKRVNLKAIETFERKIAEDTLKLAELSKDRMIIKGRRTLLKEDIF